VRDGLAAVGGLLIHAIDMLDGGGHGSNGGDSDAGGKAGHSTTDKQPIYAAVQPEPIDLALLTAAVAADEAGAVVSFEGRVRDHDEGRQVVELHYSAHPNAGHILSEAVRNLVDSRPGIRAAAAHRLGDLKIGDLAFAVAVSAAHRGAAFGACADLVDEVKRVLPVWKLQRFDDGQEEWVNCA
jgi:molybdopterin synthase catalytic subunit